MIIVILLLIAYNIYLFRKTIIDPLTGAYNVRRLCKGDKYLFIDCDNFKKINDKCGHLEGDRILKHIASVLMDSTRRGDRVIRYGGDEFCVVLKNANTADAFIERVKGQLKVSVSIGIGNSIKEADEDMYRSKKK